MESESEIRRARGSESSALHWRIPAAIAALLRDVSAESRAALQSGLPTRSKCRPAPGGRPSAGGCLARGRNASQGRQKRACFLRLVALEFVAARDAVQPALHQQRDPRSDAQCFADVVRHEDRGLLKIALERDELLLQLATRHRI